MATTEQQELIQFYHDAFASAIGSAAYEDVEEIWTELMKLEPDNVDNFLAMARELEKRKQTEQAGNFLLTLAQHHKDTNNTKGRAMALKEAARLLPREEDLKQELADFYREAYEGHPMVEAAIRKSGILRPRSVEETVPKLENLLRFKEGDIVNHPTGWGIGTISSVDLDEETLTVDFQTKKNHDVSLEMAAKILEPVEADSFKAQKHVCPEKLVEMADNDPADLIKLVTKDLGGKTTLKDVRSKLTDGIISSSNWSKWWSSARKKVLKDPYLNVGSGAAAKIELRDEPMSHHEEVFEKLQTMRSIEDKAALLDEYTRNLKAGELKVDVLEKIAQHLLKSIEGSDDASKVVQTALVMENLKDFCPDITTEPPAISDLLTPETALEAIDGMGKAALKRQALLRLKKAHPEKWVSVFSRALLSPDSDLWDFATKEMLDERKFTEVSEAFAEIKSKAKEFPENYFWLCRVALMDKYPNVLGEHSKVDLLEQLLSLMNELSRQSITAAKADAEHAKKLLSKARDVISASNYKYLKQIIEDSSEDEARRINYAANVCQGITENAREKISDFVFAEHPELAPKPTTKDAEDDAIYTTAEGLQRKQAEFDRVMNEEIPENQKALGLAISFGDLSENAEYTAAREQQGILMKKAERIEKELSKAKLIDFDSVTDDTVQIGTTIEVRHLKKKRPERYTILGPWDSDAEKGVISYLAPMAAAFIGKKVGDTAVLDFTGKDDEYEIISIKKAEV